MKKTALLLHWWWGHSEENWLPWLKKELENKAFEAFEVFVPNLPNTNNPVLEEQLEYIWVYSGNFSDWWYIIGHSLACQLAIKFIEENNISNSKIILVAPTYPNLAEELWIKILWDSFDIIKKYYDINFDFEKINKLNNEFIVFLSDNDPYINMEKAKKYYSNFKNIKFVDFSKKGHFNENAWVLELKEILEFVN